MAWDMVAGGGWEGNKTSTKNDWENGQDTLHVEERMTHVSEKQVPKDLPAII